MEAPQEPTLTSVPLVGLAVNSALAGLKIIAGVFGNSYALIADGIESTADIATSLVVWGGRCDRGSLAAGGGRDHRRAKRVRVISPAAPSSTIA